MKQAKIARRSFLQTVGLSAGSSFALATRRRLKEVQEGSGVLKLATNVYPWTTFYARDKRNFNSELDAGLSEVAAAGLDGFETLATSPAELDRLEPLLRRHGLESASLYVNSTLHLEAEANRSIAGILAIAGRARKMGTRIIVTNPNPIRWGGKESKDDAQLRFQASALDRLGRQLRDLGLVLAYHNHDVELLNSAREFHHMMLGTDPELVSLCLDAHWIYRGSGNSEVALFDVVRMYADRISEVHLRQSRNGVWTEVFEEGDINYPRLSQMLADAGRKPHLVLEQAVEKGSPSNLSALEAHRRSVAYARKVFSALAP